MNRTPVLLSLIRNNPLTPSFDCCKKKKECCKKYKKGDRCKKCPRGK